MGKSWRRHHTGTLSMSLVPVSKGSRISMHFIIGRDLDYLENVYTVNWYSSWARLSKWRWSYCRKYDKRLTFSIITHWNDTRLLKHHSWKTTQIAKSMGPTWGPPGSCRPQMGPMLAPWTLLSGKALCNAVRVCLPWRHHSSWRQTRAFGLLIWWPGATLST